MSDEATGEVDAPLEGDAVEQQEAEGTAEAPNQGAPAADGDDHQASEAANPHEGGDAEAHHEGGLEQGAATEVPGASPDGAGVHGAGMDGEGESEHAQQHDAPADEMGDPEDVAPAAIPAGELMPPAASEVASPPIPTGPMPADDAAMNEGLTSENSAFVDFLVASENFSHRKQIHLDAIFEDIKKALEIELGISATAQQLSLDDRELVSSASLRSLGVQAQSTVTIKLEVSQADRMFQMSPPSNFDYRMPDVIEVKIQYAPNVLKTLLVAVVRDMQKKPFLGGFRHKTTSIDYLHASTQTFNPKEPVDPSTLPIKYHRNSQTYTCKTRSSQCVRECGTQMDKPGLFVSTDGDVAMGARDYFDSEQLFALQLKKTIVIQCYVRGWFARKRAKYLRDELIMRKAFIADEEDRRRREVEMERMREIERRMHPRATSDFEILYNELEAWRLSETEKLRKKKLSAAEFEAQTYHLLTKEIKLLQTIDRLKVVANKENRELRVNKTLELMSAPKLWEMSDGQVAEVHTPFTTRAKELMELYNGLRMPKLTIDERLDVLLHVKWTVKEFDCNLTREIVDLIDREADLLNRGRAEKSLEGLRRRVLNLFLQFIETPEFNPEAARFQKVPRELLNNPNVLPLGKSTADDASAASTVRA